MAITNFDDFLAEQMKDEEFHKEYEALEPEFAIMQAIVLNPDKADEFINKRIDPAVKAEILRKAERIRKTYIKDDRFKK